MSIILDGTTGVPVTTVTGTLPVANGGTGGATSTGSGATVLATFPTLTTPVLSGSVTGTYTLAGTPTMGASVITAGTAVATTSGTSVDFTSIPSWVKRITVIINNVSTAGSAALLLQIGSGSVTTSGYSSLAVYTGAGAGSTGVVTTGFVLMRGGGPEAHTGHYTITLISGTTYIGSGVYSWNAGGSYGSLQGGYSPALSGALDRVRFTTVNGTDTFDLGSVNILYE